jgi:uncharacterized repeat protein (TIGR02543 family)
VVPYYVEALKQDGSEGERKSDGLYYVLHHNDSSNGTAGLSVTSEDRYPITGFTVNTNLSSKNGASYGSAKFYYTRNSYNIIFINNGKTLDTKTLKYEANLAAAAYTPAVPSDMPEGTTFDGWYTNELLEGDKYVFEGKMPAQNITLYAKWKEPTRDAEIYFDIILETGSTTITVPYGEKTLKIAVVSGLGNAEALLNRVKAGEHFDFIEIMACPGGCVNGGGQPYGGRTGIDERSRGLYEADRLQSIRRSQENPAVETLYRDIIGDRAHELLHVDYTKNRK